MREIFDPRSSRKRCSTRGINGEISSCIGAAWASWSSGIRERGRTGWLLGRGFGILRGRRFARGQTAIPAGGNEFPRWGGHVIGRHAPGGDDVTSHPLADDLVRPVLRVGMPRASRLTAARRTVIALVTGLADHERGRDHGLVRRASRGLRLGRASAGAGRPQAGARCRRGPSGVCWPDARGPSPPKAFP